jgi:hypothetical protein
MDYPEDEPEYELPEVRVDKIGYDDVLSDIYFNNKSGFVGLNELIRRTRDTDIPIDYVKKWYKSQPVNQIIIPRRQKIAYHKIIGDGSGFQADIIFFPYPRLNHGFVGLLTFINTSTRMAYVYPIKNRTTEEIYDKIDSLLKLLDEMAL